MSDRDWWVPVGVGAILLTLAAMGGYAVAASLADVRIGHTCRVARAAMTPRADTLFRELVPDCDRPEAQ